jgi:hypothetical protein
MDTGNNEHRVIHYAVYNRSPEMVRLLMQHGADAPKGLWPIREATTALTFAVERGYDEIAGIIREEEHRRAQTTGAISAGSGSHRDDAWPEALSEAARSTDETSFIAALEASLNGQHVLLLDGASSCRGRSGMESCRSVAGGTRWGCEWPR